MSQTQTMPPAAPQPDAYCDYCDRVTPTGVDIVAAYAVSYIVTRCAVCRPSDSVPTYGERSFPVETSRGQEYRVLASGPDMSGGGVGRCLRCEATDFLSNLRRAGCSYCRPAEQS